MVARENSFCFVEEIRHRGPRSVNMYETSPTEVTHVEASVFTPEAISRKTFRRLTKDKKLPSQEKKKK